MHLDKSLGVTRDISEQNAISDLNAFEISLPSVPMCTLPLLNHHTVNGHTAYAVKATHLASDATRRVQC